MASPAASPPQELLNALRRPETFYSLSYRLGLDAQACQSWLETLIAQRAVVRLGTDEGAVYFRAED